MVFEMFFSPVNIWGPEWPKQPQAPRVSGLSPCHTVAGMAQFCGMAQGWLAKPLCRSRDKAIWSESRSAEDPKMTVT